jgi:uncharacterized iron-regulated membrane protein
MNTTGTLDCFGLWENLLLMVLAFATPAMTPSGRYTAWVEQRGVSVSNNTCKKQSYKAMIGDCYRELIGKL